MYIKTNWQNGITPLNAENLNHIEDGIANNDAAITNLNQKSNAQAAQITDLGNKIAKIGDEIVSGYVDRVIVNTPSGNYEQDITATIFEDADLTTPLITKDDVIYIDKLTNELFKTKIAGTNQLTPVNCSINTYYRNIINSINAAKASIEYVDQKFNGAAKAIGYMNYESMINALNVLSSDIFNVGQDILVVTTGVPDVWVYEIADTNVPYTYVDDATFVNELETNGYVQVGYYKLAELETRKIDLTNYQTKLTPTNVPSGTIIESIGFNANNELVRGSGGSYYHHNIGLRESGGVWYFDFISQRSTAYDYSSFAQWLYDNNFKTEFSGYGCNVTCGENTSYLVGIIKALYSENGTTIRYNFAQLYHTLSIDFDNKTFNFAKYYNNSNKTLSNVNGFYDSVTPV